MTDEQGPEAVWAHLQAAAHELIAAARIALDFAEEVVTESLRRVGEPDRPTPPRPPVERIEVLPREDGSPD